MPLDQVQKFLRHKRITTTQIYAETSLHGMSENYVRALGGKGGEMHAPRSPNGSEVIRVIVAFVVAELAAAVIYAAEFAAEGGFRLDMFLFIFALSFIVAFPFVLLGGVPLWMVLRLRRVQAPWRTFALAGIVLGLSAYLILVAMGMSAPSYCPMTFAENITRPFHVARVAAAMIAGGAGAVVFWSLAVKNRSTLPKFGPSLG